MLISEQCPSPRQLDVLDAIRAHIAEHAVSPTISELCSRLGTKSVGSMSKHLNILEKCGSIKRSSRWRGIRVTGVCPYCGAQK